MKAVPLNAALARSPHRLAAARLWTALTQASALIGEWRRRSRSRADLARLDLRMLRDIGLTPGDVLHEVNKPFWRK